MMSQPLLALPPIPLPMTTKSVSWLLSSILPTEESSREESMSPSKGKMKVPPDWKVIHLHIPAEIKAILQDIVLLW
jgi:hypothetical protein